MPLAILVRSAAQRDPPRLLVRDRCVSDHVQSNSGNITFDLAGASRSRGGSELESRRNGIFRS